jgi:hypothetical protein
MVSLNTAANRPAVPLTPLTRLERFGAGTALYSNICIDLGPILRASAFLPDWVKEGKSGVARCSALRGKMSPFDADGFAGAFRDGQDGVGGVDRF